MSSKVDEMFDRRHRALQRQDRKNRSFSSSERSQSKLLQTSASTYRSETNIGISVFAHNPSAADIEARPAALARWSADDYVVEELWPAAQESREDKSGISSSSSTSVPRSREEDLKDVAFAVVDVTAEGISDQIVIQKLRQRCAEARVGDGNAKGPQFLFPCDFFTSWTRRVRLPKRVLLQDSLAMNNSATILALSKGNVYVSAATPVYHSDLTLPHSMGLPLSPPTRRYTIVLRGIEGSIDSISKKWQNIGDTGVINYCPHVRHGEHASRAYDQGQSLMNRDYTSFLVHHLRSLTEGLPLLQEEVQHVEDLLRDPIEGRKAAAWRQAVTGINVALGRSESVLKKSAFTGVYENHPAMLLSAVERFASLCTTSHGSAAVLDPALLIRETTSKRVLQDKLRTVADVHFNALASLRVQWLGPAVRVGDLVCTNPLLNLDPFETKPDHLYGFGEEHQYVYWEQRAHEQVAWLHQQGLIKRIETEAEARQYQLTDIVLPRLGRRLDPTDPQRDALLYPAHKVNQSVFDDLSTRLGVAHLREMRLAPVAGYRRLIVKPVNQALFLSDAARNITWGAPHLGKRAYIDGDNVTRFTSPVGRLSERKHLARYGIPRSRREPFAAIGQRPGFVCALEMELAVGTSPQSVLREMFRVKTVDTGAVARMLLK